MLPIIFNPHFDLELAQNSRAYDNRKIGRDGPRRIRSMDLGPWSVPVRAGPLPISANRPFMGIHRAVPSKQQPNCRSRWPSATFRTEAMEAEDEAGGRRPKRIKRKEVLEKKKAVDELIKAAYSQKDHLSSVPSFWRYCTNGLSVFLESGSGDKLPSSLKKYIQELLKVNMEGPFGSEWPTEEKVKRREMVVRQARYIFVYEDPNADGNHQMSAFEDRRNSIPRSSVVGFVHYRFVVEEEVPVLYLYELQLETRVQGKGLGKFLMRLIEAIARQNRMSAVVLSVQKANLSAMKFYMTKLGYVISGMSPSRVHFLTGLETNYEILCKVFDDEAKSALE